MIEHLNTILSNPVKRKAAIKDFTYSVIASGFMMVIFLGIWVATP